MPRLARLDAPGVVHHVIIRGIEKRKIFLDNKDRDNLFDRLSHLVPETNTSCYAWAFLSNHAHFLLQTGGVGLSKLMRRLLTGYAVTFNRRHRRHGHLFQNRYKSIVCQEDIYLKELVRYIHLNPLRARVVENMTKLNSYKYCGHGVLLGKKECAWQNTKYILSYFGRRNSEARRRYLSYVKEGIKEGRKPELVGGGMIRSLGGWEEIKKLNLKALGGLKGDERILGESDFVQEILSYANESYSRPYELKRQGYDLKKIEQRVLEIFKIKKEELYFKNREKRRVEARSVLCYWAVRELGIKGTEMAKLMGLSQPAIVYAVKRGEKFVKEAKLRLII